MLLPDWAVLDAIIDWLGHGLWNLTWWQIVLYTLVTTHITIAAVTIFLHRAQAHRALELHAIPSHFFRFWLWVGTGMQTKEWVAIHRKHHAKRKVSGSSGAIRPPDQNQHECLMRQNGGHGYLLISVDVTRSTPFKPFGVWPALFGRASTPLSLRAAICAVLVHLTAASLV